MRQVKENLGAEVKVQGASGPCAADMKGKSWDTSISGH